MARFPWKAVAAGGVVAGVLGVVTLLTRRATAAPLGRVALVGDSYAAGLTAPLKSLLPDFQAEGHAGTNTWQWLSRSPACGQCGAWLLAFKPDIILVSLGVNDGASPDLANYQQIVQIIHGLGAQVVWIEPPAGVNVPVLRSIIRSLGVKTIPATHVPLISDGLHPTVDGYREWAAEIVRVLRGS